MKQRIRHGAIFMLALGLLFGGELPGGSQQATGTLRIVVERIRIVQGTIFVSLPHSEELYKLNWHESIRSVKEKVADNPTTVIIDKLPLGRWYAVKAFHDVNDNNTLDTYPIGLPREPFGFSNNGPIVFGPPSWDNARFRFDEDGQTIVIRLKEM